MLRKRNKTCGLSCKEQHRGVGGVKGGRPAAMTAFRFIRQEQWDLHVETKGLSCGQREQNYF